MRETLLALLLLLAGCSMNEQRAKIKVIDPVTREAIVSIDLKVSKSNLAYWSRFQADTDTFGMTTRVYNAEGRPDADTVQAITEGIVQGVVGAVK